MSYSALNEKALVGAFNQEKALVGAFSVIVKTNYETDGSFYSTRLQLVVVAVEPINSNPTKDRETREQRARCWYKW